MFPYYFLLILTLLTLRWQECPSSTDASDLGLGTDSVLPGSSAGAALFSAYQDEVRRQQGLANANANASSNSSVPQHPDAPQHHPLKTSANAAASDRSDNADKALEAELGFVPRRSAEWSRADASSSAALSSSSASVVLPPVGNINSGRASAGVASARSSDRDADALRLPPLMRAATVVPPRSAAAVAATSSLIIRHGDSDEETDASASSSSSEASQSILALASTLNRIGSRQASPLAGARTAPPLGQIESSLASIMAASLLSAEAEAAAFTAADVESMSVSKMVSQRQAAGAGAAVGQTSMSVDQQHVQHDAAMRAPSPTKHSRILHAASQSQSQSYPASSAMSEMEEYYQVRPVQWLDCVSAHRFFVNSISRSWVATCLFCPAAAIVAHAFIRADRIASVPRGPRVDALCADRTCRRN